LIKLALALYVFYQNRKLEHHFYCRLILRCRQLARTRFAKLRSDVLVKMELLDNKHVQSLGGHLTKLIKGLSEVHTNALELFSGPALFPVEVDLSNSAFQYKSTTPVVQVI
jgi:hypothetical protein